MSRFRRLVSAVLCLSMLVSATSASAQTAVAAAGAAARSTSSNDTMAAGLLEGETLGEGQRTGANLAAGLVVGLLTGLIGTGIGYFVVGPTSLSAEALQRSTAKSSEFQLGLKTGWEKKTQSKKRGAFLAGGLLGTAAWIVLIAGARGGE